MIKVNDTSYTWMGFGEQVTRYAEQISFKYTSTRSIFEMTVGNAINMTVTFTSPVTPNDLLRSSLPYTYMEVEVVSIDGYSHDVQLYTDISAGIQNLLLALVIYC